MPYYTQRAWWCVDDLSALLRVNRKTIYAAIADGSLPAKKVGPYYRVPAEALGFIVKPETKTRTYHVTDDMMQYELDLGPIVPIKLYRDGSPRDPWDYENAKWRVM